MSTRIGIVAPNWLGDAVMALPAIADVRRGSPGARISVVARPPITTLFTLVRDVDDVLEKGATRVGDQDVAILLPNSFRSAYDVRRAGIRERWGYRTDGRRWLLTRAIARAGEATHQVDSYQQLVEALGFPNGERVPRLTLPPESRRAGAEALSAAGWDGVKPIVALAPGAAYGGAKRWPPEYFAELARGFADDGIVSVIVGSSADAPTAAEIVGAAGHRRSAILDLVGRTDVATLAGALAHARVIVSNDSGAVHLAAAVGVPVTAVFGPTSERLAAPRSAAASVVLRHDVWCRPCMLRECPIDHRCMRGVSVAAAADAARRLL